MDNYANNLDDSDQESADEHMVMSPLPAPGSLLKDQERTAAGRQDQRLGTSPTFPLFLPPFRYNLQECTCHSVPTVTRIIRLSSQQTKHSLKAHPSSGVCPSHCFSKAQSGSLLLSKQINLLSISLSGLTCYSEQAQACCALEQLLPQRETEKPPGRAGSYLMSSFPNSLTLIGYPMLRVRLLT